MSLPRRLTRPIRRSPASEGREASYPAVWRRLRRGTLTAYRLSFLQVMISPDLS
jgi:hypothetical protein